MRNQEPARTIIVVSAKKAEPGMEREMEPLGIRVLWADSIKAATALLDLAPNGTARPHRIGTQGWQLERLGRRGEAVSERPYRSRS